MRNINDKMTVVELKEVAKKMGMAGYSKLTKAKLIEAINLEQTKRRDAYKKAIAEAQAKAKDELLADYSKAVSFWKVLKDVKALRPEDYPQMVLDWKILQILSDDSTVIEANLDKLAEVMRKIFAPTVAPSVIANYSVDEKREYIESLIETFRKDTKTEILRKDSYSILKMSLADLEYDSNGRLIFDSGKAIRLTSEDISVIEKTSLSIEEAMERKNVMRYVDTAEDGISRLLQTKKDGQGLSTVTINMAEVGDEEEEKKAIEEKKREVFTNGFTDVASNIHYFFAFQNPSSTRKANFMCVEADSYQEVYELWYEVTGTKNHEGFQNAFHANEGVVLAKMLARTSSRGSNSFDLDRVAPEYSDVIRNAKVLYIPDASASIFRDFKTLSAPNVLEMKSNEERNVTPGDGMIIGSFEFHAHIAAAMRIIDGISYSKFISLWDECGRDAMKAVNVPGLKSIIDKIPGVFQLRQGSDKGISVKYNYDNVKVVLTQELADTLNKLNVETFTKGQTICLGDYDLLCPESVRKFVGGEWNEYPLEICNYLKSKKDWVCLNPQFIAALSAENPNMVNPIVDYWINYMKSSFSDIGKMEQFMNIVNHSDEDVNVDNASANLSDILTCNYKLRNDHQVLKFMQAKYAKFIEEMKVGKIRVPGQYTYMICDPAFIINNIFGVDLNCLGEGEYYHNNKDCEAGLFRSPLIAPFEAQKVRLTVNDSYWYMKDVIVFNGFDGAWDRMGGGDFDGDTCAVVCNDDRFGFGKIIVDAIRNSVYDVWEPAQKAKKEVWSEDDNSAFIEYLVRSAKRDRTGEITNHATRILDLSNHLVACVKFAKMLDCETVTFLHPTSFGVNQNWGRDFIPCKKMNNGHNTFAVRGLVAMKWNSESKKFDFAEDGIVGEKSFDEVIALSNDKLTLVEILRILQGREIDGAKTGVYAEGISGQDYTDAVKEVLTPQWLISRQKFLKRPVTKNAENNKFVSLSVMGRIHDYVCREQNKVYDLFEAGTNKIALLKSLLTDEEMNLVYNATVTKEQVAKAFLNEDTGMTLQLNVPSMNLMSFVEYLKSEYNKKVFSLSNMGATGAASSDELDNSISALKLREGTNLNSLAEAVGVSTEVIAAIAYIVTYNKQEHQANGLSYAWILYPELLSIFSRDNNSFELYPLPKHTTEATIYCGFIYVNGQKYRPVVANDGDLLIQYFGGSKPYALIHKKNGNAVEPRTSKVFANATYEIGVYGFRYNKAVTKDNWKTLVSANNHEFDIVLDGNGSAVISINGETISALMPNKNANDNTDFHLVGKKVKVIGSPNYAETDATIKGLTVIVVGSAN